MTKNITEVKIEKFGMEAKPYDKVLAKVAELCPAAVQNGKVDFERLKAELADKVDENTRETYEFKWVGKNAAMVEANKPIRKTLRPCKEESKNWDTTENLYIEGDNLEVLKLLEEGYLGKIKMIYIDPPYNTGNDFVYHDNRVQSEDEMNECIGLFDEEENRLLSSQFVRNTESSGRFHSDWCSMMYPRLKLARDLLTDDGVIFISIDDHEVANLKKICDEVFGEDNFINCIAVKMSEASGVKMNHQYKRFPKIKEYILFYKRNSFSRFNTIDKYKQEDWDQENNIYLSDFTQEDRNDLIRIENIEIKSKQDILCANKILSKAKKVSLAEKIKEISFKDENEQRNWLFDNSYRIIKTAGSSSLATLVKNLDYKLDQDIAAELSSEGVLFYYLTDFNRETKQPRLQVIFADANIYKNPCDFWQDIKTTGAIAEEGGIKYPNGKKPLKLLNRIVKMTTTDNDIVLDFFAGSSTTAHSVMQQNFEDGSKRKTILVQLPENLDENLRRASDKKEKENIKEMIAVLDEIHRPHLLTEIGKERIRRAGDKIVQETGKTDLDIGFRVLKVDDSNMQDVYYNPSELKQSDLLSSVDNIKADRTPLDLLFGVMVEWGVSLSLPLQEVKVGENTIHIVGDNDLVACFDKQVSTKTITKMAELNPTRVVFRDSCFEKDDEKINMFEIFKTICHLDDKQAKDNVRVM